jgi:DNA end-binding protein Ku
MPRELWKGAIHFGLVHIPVSLYPAEQSEELSFTMLDRRDLQPVGYKRYNKSTGDEVPFDQIVKGYEYDDGHYVTLEKEDFKRAKRRGLADGRHRRLRRREGHPAVLPRVALLPLPGKHGEKGYALLREVLERTGKVAVANVVIRTRQHLSIVYPAGKLLVLNTVRYQNELRDTDDIKAPADLKDAKVKPNELNMAERLIDDMVMKWNPKEFHDTYRDDLLKLIEEKAKGKVKAEPKSKRAPREAQVIDFASLLEKSLASRKRHPAEEPAAPRRAAGTKRAAAAKTRRKAAAPRARAHSRAA